MATAEVSFKGKDERLVIRPIMRSVNPNVTDPDHEAFFLFGGASRDYVLPMNRSGNLVNPFNNDNEKAWLEKELDVDLNVNKQIDNYWHKYKVRLNKAERKLNLLVPQDYMDYLVLSLNRNLIAPIGTRKDGYLATQRYCIVREEDETQEVFSRAGKEIEAYKAFGKMEDDKLAMINFLKVYGQSAVNVGPKRVKFTMGSKRELLVKTISEVLEKDLNGFLAVARDKDNYDIKLLIADAVECGSVIKDSRKYFLVGGDPMCEEGIIPTLDNVVSWLKNPKNQEILLMLKARVATAKE